MKSRNNKENNENAEGLKKVERSRKKKPLVQFQTKYMSTTDVEIVNGNVAWKHIHALGREGVIAMGTERMHKEKLRTKGPVYDW